ncbi:hypothetical protein JYU34_017123 [Plutella xylostella]|uniref:Uncharacterized protein n=1 Tax=Plutella xylostella TaxID=51655 RepID=A0ABQ7Q0F7_PLUXY|nr:circadian clock-controlled protein daywake-like [Plutella xylostella]KAG7298716.1 hypothetical protein JYU34_017123 [Plutella xylostella]
MILAKSALCLSLVSCVLCIALPDYLKSCSRNDPNLNACALQVAQSSITRFAQGEESRGLVPLDPLFVPEMVVYVPNENGLKVRFLDNHFTGLSQLQMQDLKFDLNKKVITTDCLVNLEVLGRYDLSGKILVVPIKSNGDSTIRLKNTLLHIRFWYEHVAGPGGAVHWRIVKHDIKYEVEKATFRLENLLNDKNIGDQINRLLNEMWREIVSEVGPSISKSLVDAVVENIQVLLSQVSYDELMPE